MGSIKYYQLAKDEELPDEFCAVRDVGGEPSEYTFYVPESEIAKLREKLVDTPKCETCEAMLDCDECLRADVSHKELRRLSTENACLREMCRDMLHDAMENVCSKARWCDEKNWQTCNDKECGNRLYVEMARELGIEVDDGTK